MAQALRSRKALGLPIRLAGPPYRPGLLALCRAAPYKEIRTGSCQDADPMFIDCPSCGTRFLIDPGLITPDGRTVRCGRCGHNWYQTPMVGNQDAPPAQPAAAPAPAAVAPDSPAMPPLQEFDEARRRAAASPSRRALPGPTTVVRRGPSWVAIGWAALVVFVGLLVGGALIGRDYLIAKVPETERLYAMVGLMPEEIIGEGLDIRDVTQVRRLVNGARTLLIEGSIVNETDQPVSVPAVLAVITNASGESLVEWTFSADGSELPPGGITTFQTSTQDPPAEGALNLLFVAAE